MDDNSLLTLRNVVKRRTVGHGYSLTVDHFSVVPGRRLALIGDSGSGKSTLMDMLAMISKPDEADEFVFAPEDHDVSYDLKDIWRKRRYSVFEKLRRSELGYIMQTGGLLPFLSVADNISLPASLKRSISKAERKARLKALTEEMGIGHLLKKLPSQISVGERQRCAIARALIHDPSLVLADEPTASLDPPTADKIFRLLSEVCRDRALIISTHERRRVVGNPDFEVWQIRCETKEEDQSIAACLTRFVDMTKKTQPSLAYPPSKSLH
ncbi:MAG: ATP-binding cassette domain-containing protein [Deltaproteobacteria bacterium]|jgi:putative ABC transport system ATP-binding protein|nr:ATP-binding cassette domain-containing protein [Deltaproteobacteria bacterium]